MDVVGQTSCRHCKACKSLVNQTPENKAYMMAYRQTEKCKASRSLYKPTEKSKANKRDYDRERRKRPEVKALQHVLYAIRRGNQKIANKEQQIRQLLQQLEGLGA